MNSITAIGKFLDQPILTAKLNKAMPYALGGAMGLYLLNKSSKYPKEERQKQTKKDAIILAATVISAISAPKIAGKIASRAPLLTYEQVKNKNTKLVDEFVKQSDDDGLNKILEKSKTKLLSLKEIAQMFNKDKNIADKIIPPPENIKASDIFREIGYLSVYGFIPVLGGVGGGVIADRIYEDDWKKRVPNKINEGLYQYLANIFLCNIGAGSALGILEKLGIQSKGARCLGMVAGIILTGVIGGSMIANFISQKIVNPLLSKENKLEKRTPEPLDLTLHTDDIATVSLLSGLKWIEPMLPMLYTISGYRAGIGYRN